MYSGAHLTSCVYRVHALGTEMWLRERKLAAGKPVQTDAVSLSVVEMTHRVSAVPRSPRRLFWKKLTN